MTITVQPTLQAPIEQIWACWTAPEHIVNWNFASDEWHCPSGAVNDLHPGGAFNWRMEAKDGSMGFDFEGTYEKILQHELISYRMTDGRKVEIRFVVNGPEVTLTESFQTEGTNSDEQQRTGWRSWKISSDMLNP